MQAEAVVCSVATHPRAIAQCHAKPNTCSFFFCSGWRPVWVAALSDLARPRLARQSQILALLSAAAGGPFGWPPCEMLHDHDLPHKANYLPFFPQRLAARLGGRPVRGLGSYIPQGIRAASPATARLSPACTRSVSRRPWLLKRRPGLLSKSRRRRRHPCRPPSYGWRLGRGPAFAMRRPWSGSASLATSHTKAMYSCDQDV